MYVRIYSGVLKAR